MLYTFNRKISKVEKVFKKSMINKQYLNTKLINLIHMGSNYWLSGTHLRGNDFLGSMEVDVLYFLVNMVLYRKSL